jgi:hypothetical protein
MRRVSVNLFAHLGPSGLPPNHGKRAARVSSYKKPRERSDTQISAPAEPGR